MRLLGVAGQGGGVTPPPPADLPIEGITYFTANYDNTSKGPGTQEAWRTLLNTESPSRWGDGVILGIREGEGHGLPSVEGGPWNKPQWILDLEPGGAAHGWFAGKGLKLFLHQLGLGLGSLPGVRQPVSDQCLRNLKWRAYKLMTETDLSLVGVLILNEGDKPGTAQGSYDLLGGDVSSPDAASAANVIANICEMANALREQFEQLTPLRPGVPNYPATPMPIPVCLPTWAEPAAANATGKAGIYPTAAAMVAGPRKSGSALSIHHHQGIGNPSSTWRYGTNGFGQPPQSGAADFSLYHGCKALKDADPDHGYPLIADESAVCRNTHMNFSGWGTDDETLDVLRAWTVGVMFCSLLEHGPSLWAYYATRTGDYKYRCEKDWLPGFPMYPSWDAFLAQCGHLPYDINLLSGGVIPIVAKNWQDFGDPRTLCVQCPTRQQPLNSYASGLAPFAEWLETSIFNGIIMLEAGVEKHIHRPIWLRQQREHTISVDLRATSSGAKGRLAIMGHDKLDGTARVVSDEVTYGQGWRTVTASVTPRQHEFFPNARYLRATIDHNGGGDLEAKDWRIT